MGGSLKEIVNGDGFHAWIIVIHGKQTDKVPGNYTRYLEKTFRKALKLEGTPVRIELRSGDNPFVKSEENLNAQQVARKRRLAKNKDTNKKPSSSKRHLT